MPWGKFLATRGLFIGGLLSVSLLVCSTFYLLGFYDVDTLHNLQKEASVQPPIDFLEGVSDTGDTIEYRVRAPTPDTVLDGYIEKLESGGFAVLKTHKNPENTKAIIFAKRKDGTVDRYLVELQ